LRVETDEKIRQWFGAGVSLAGMTSMIYILKLEEGKGMKYMLVRKLVEKEIARIQSGKYKKEIDYQI